VAVVEGPELERWRRAARIAADARERGVRWAVPGTLRRELADRIEGYIRDQGAEPAFPANISRNVEAAHYTPDPEDAARLEAGDLVKIDVGAHLDGAIADTAMTLEVGGGKRHENLIRAAVEGLAAGVAAAHAGAAVDEVSRAIESAIHRRGVKPVHNLTGHSIDRYLLHAGKAIPNVRGMSTDRLVDGEIIAIEPFATNGAGEIHNGPFGNILRFRQDPGAAAPELRGAFGRFRTLPFALRWIPDPTERDRVRRARRYLQAYPVFVESGEGFVAQAEHTVRVGPGGAEVLTTAGEAPAA
jgi:methionyl aminopeptidase